VKTEKIIADAEVAAVFLRALTDKGVPMNAAIQLTCSYLSSARIIEAAGEEPREPWQDPSA